VEGDKFGQFYLTILFSAFPLSVISRGSSQTIYNHTSETGANLLFSNNQLLQL
jgi:hypothetical protein